jgi:hypothetical protein
LTTFGKPLRSKSRETSQRVRGRSRSRKGLREEQSVNLVSV